MQAEGLQGSCEGEEEQGGCYEDAEVEMDEAGEFQERVRRGHYVLFTQRCDMRQVQSDIAQFAGQLDSLP